MDIVLDENLGPVIEIGDQCYELVGAVDIPPDTQAVEATAIYETCDECEATDSSTASSTASSAVQVVAEEGSSAAADSSTDSSGIIPVALVGCDECDCPGFGTKDIKIEFTPTCGGCSGGTETIAADKSFNQCTYFQGASTPSFANFFMDLGCSGTDIYFTFTYLTAGKTCGMPNYVFLSDLVECGTYGPVLSFQVDFFYDIGGSEDPCGTATITFLDSGTP
jgi:hypothetical protein